jgi:hypothetical protein
MEWDSPFSLIVYVGWISFMYQFTMHYAVYLGFGWARQFLKFWRV